eukprot:COSAG02_NODE_2296_length_9197_cov_11.568587_1_plen_81_part_00
MPVKFVLFSCRVFDSKFRKMQTHSDSLYLPSVADYAFFSRNANAMMGDLQVPLVSQVPLITFTQERLSETKTITVILMLS